MFVHKSDQFTSIAFLVAMLLMGVVSSETSSNTNDNTSSEGDTSNVAGIRTNTPEQVEFVNVVPSHVNNHLSKFFQVDSAELPDEALSRPSISVLRPVSKFSSFFRQIRPVASPSPSLQFIGDNVMSEVRARRYSYPKGQSSQSFLRFGRAYDSSILAEKRPMKSKDTAFLRFGRSQL